MTVNLFWTRSACALKTRRWPSELRRQVLHAHVGVLHHVVEQRRGDRSGVEQLPDEDGGNGDGVGDERLPRHPFLAPVGGSAETERPFDQVQVEPVGVKLQDLAEARRVVRQRLV